jgi:branched-chain amino acid aminotransferase
MTNEMVAYFNGRIVPESEVLISFRDSSAMWGIGVHDSSRTFKGEIFRLREHLDRLERNLRYMRIDAGLSMAELEDVTRDVVARNLAIAGGDISVTQRISRGPTRGEDYGPPTVIVESSPIRFQSRAHWFTEGVRLATSTIRRTPAWAESPQAKTVNRLNLVMATEDVWALDRDAWALLCDENLNLAEGRWYNVFVVVNGTLLTPSTQHVLPGITRATVLELAEKLSIPTFESDISVYDAYNADEIFVTSTSVVICPVSSINGRHPREGAIPGPVTGRLQQAFTDLVGVDFVRQYTDHLSEPLGRSTVERVADVRVADVGEGSRV